ncbi:HlyD family secretion protein [Desulfatirhabdium butyrativorans]|uniref:HlyD family secretion protein n=1 Tax=Desulfatirhabdium butyrativorans TaxID=340467 RepID=UPI000429351B|nr:HlyD family secretion protein [Desulfatirhabdium butyrativorans]
MTTTNEPQETRPAGTGEGVAAGAPARTAGLSARKKLIRISAAALVILALAFGIPVFIHSLSHESTDDAFIDGTVVAISPRVNGYVAKVHVTDNQRVKVGDLLVELDPNDFTARLDAAQAALEAARATDRARRAAVELTRITTAARLEEAKENVEAAKAALLQARARLAVSKASLDQARAEAASSGARRKLDAADLQRSVEMAKTRTISPQDLDHARTAAEISEAALTAATKKIEVQKALVAEAEASLKAAQAGVAQARARLAEAQSAPHQIRQSSSQAEAAKADIDRASAELAQAKLNLSYTRIQAPCDGFVTKKGIEPGQYVQAGQSLLALVPHDVWVSANFKETQLTRMQPGQPVEVTVDAFPKRRFHAHVDSIQRGTGARFSLLPPENATGNYVKVVQRVPVKIVFDRPEEIAAVLLAPGMSVIPDVDVGMRMQSGAEAPKQRAASTP